MNDPLEIRNLGFPGATLTREERSQLRRLQDKLLRVTRARLGPIPGFEWDVDVAAVLAKRAQPAGEWSGPATGYPVGAYESRMTVEWRAPNGNGRARGTFSLSARTGLFSGKVRATVTPGAGAARTYIGTATVTKGTNVYIGWKSIGGLPLQLNMTTNVAGDAAEIELRGRVTSARVKGGA